MKLTPEFKAQWIAALRSGKYLQGQYCLYNKRCNAYCCLGVGAELAGDLDKDSINRNFGVTRSTNNGALWGFNEGYLSYKDMRELQEMNDAGFLFSGIADWIEECL